MPHIARVLIKDINILLTKPEDAIIIDTKNQEKNYHHLANVLRVKMDDDAIVFNGFQNANLLCKVSEIDKKQITLIVKSVDIKQVFGGLSKKIMILPLLKRDNLEEAIKTCTEIGVDEFCFVKTQNCHASEKTINFTRLNEITLSAAMQCGLNLLPTFNKQIVSLQNIGQFFNNDNAVLLFANEHLSGNGTNMVALQNKRQSNVFMLIGPEGGFTKQEVDFVLSLCSEKIEVKNISLGSNILRASTAASVMAFMGVNFFI